MVEVKGVTFTYKPGSRNVLQEIGFALEGNQCIAVLGNNGAGKSTLLKCINGICLSLIHI